MYGLWVAIDSTTDRQERARRLAAARESVLAGSRPPDDLVREVIIASWQRSRAAGVDADRGLAPVPVGVSEARARWQDHRLARVLPAVRELLHETSRASEQALLFCDADGTILWIEGEPRVVHRARDVRLEPGAVWSESAAGTNAMGTALVTGHPVQVFSAEHYARPVHEWTCSAAPIRDPETGAAIGALDLSGDLATAHPHSLAVVSAAARIVEQELQRLSDVSDSRLVRRYGDRVGLWSVGPGALTSGSGRVLVSEREELLGSTLELPPDGGPLVLPDGSDAMAEPLAEGQGFLLWSERLRAKRSVTVAEPSAPEVALQALGRDSAALAIGRAAHVLSPRHSELLALFALRPSGWTAEQLTSELMGDLGKQVSVRAELSRLRRILGSLLESQPYRLASPVKTDFGRVECELDRGDVAQALECFAAGELLPGSNAPTIVETRFRLTMSVREAVVASDDAELLATWLRMPAGDDDAQACRALMALCPPADPRHALAAGRLRRLAGAH